jgi:outer membrane protein assembly factor BamB
MDCDIHMRFPLRASLSAAAAWALLGGVLAAAEGTWPGWLGPNRDGCSTDTGLLKSWPAGGPPLLWKVDTLGPGWSSVAVANDRVYTTGNADGKQMLICLDMNGKDVWRVEQGPRCRHKDYPGARSTPTVDGDRVYVTGGNGLVTCHKAADGQIVWKREMAAELGGKVGGWLYAESVLILDDLAIVTPGGKNGIVALDKATGQEVWKSDASFTAGYSSCIPVRAAGSTILVNGSQNGLVAVDAKTGRKVWENAFAARNTANVPTPAYEGGFLFWAVGYGKGGICFKVDFKDGQWSFQEAWTTRDLNNHPGNYVVSRGRVYGSGKGLTCVDLQTGQTLWSARDAPPGQCCWADGMAYVLSAAGGKASLVEPSAAEGKVTGKVQVAGTGNSWSHPVVVGGRLYLRYDTNLYCFDVKGR